MSGRSGARLARRLLQVVAALAVVGGVLVIVRSASQPVTVGTFAYAPLTGEALLAQGVHVVSTTTLVAAAVVVVGLVLLAFAAGVRAGARAAGGDLDGR
ncbi:hypothetical protein [Clavibacter sp. km1a]|uniref:hypothetical protein n=1 Tax=Clavibacter sp. km1a TaxID=3459136 RepID=UPI00404272B9